MLRIRLALTVWICAGLLALPLVAHAQNGTITGTAALRLLQGSSPAGTTSLRVRLVEVVANRGPVVIAEQVIATTGRNSPFTYSLPYTAARIDQNRAYLVEGSFIVNGVTTYQTAAQYPVLTRGNSTTANIILDPVRLPQTSDGSLLLVATLLLLILFVAIRSLRVWAHAETPLFRRS